jgi:hypothetical protein
MIASSEHRPEGFGLAWGSTQQLWACRISHVLGLIAVLLMLVYLAS